MFGGPMRQFFCRMAARSLAPVALVITVLFAGTICAADSSLRIISAKWGAGARQADVSQKLQGLIKDGHLEFTVIVVTLGEPAYGVVKDLEVIYEFEGKRVTGRFKDSERVSLGTPAPLEPPLSDPILSKLNVLSEG